MIEQLFNLIKEESQNEIINNPAIPNEFNDQAVGLATESVFSGLQSHLANGGLQDVLGMFAGGQAGPSTSNALMGGMTDNFVKGMMSKFGIDSPMAQTIAASVIPMVIGKLVSRTNDPANNGFDINGIIGSLIGGGNNQSGSPVELPGLQSGQGAGGIDFGGILKSLTSGGLDSNHDGQIGIEDIAGMVTRAAGGAQQQSQQGPQGGGGMMDILKGLIGG